MNGAPTVCWSEGAMNRAPTADTTVAIRGSYSNCPRTQVSSAALPAVGGTVLGR